VSSVTDSQSETAQTFRKIALKPAKLDKPSEANPAEQFGKALLNYKNYYDPAFIL